MIFDSHSDIWSDVFVKSLQGEKDVFRKYHYEKLQKGKIEGAIFVIWIDPPYDKTPEVRFQQILEAVRQELPYCRDILRIVHNYEEMQKAREEGIFYVFPGCEGLSGIGADLGQIELLYDAGVRHASLTWNEQNLLASGIGGDSESGLTELGVKALHKIQELGMLFDVSHLNDKSFWDVMRHARGPVVATHSNSRRLCPAPRNLTDEMIKELIGTGGMIGVNAYPTFLTEREEDATVAMLARHIEHMADIAGIDNIGFGFDFCGFLEGFNPTLPGLQDASETENILAAMQEVGFTKGDIQKVSYLNWHRMIQKIL